MQKREPKVRYYAALLCALWALVFYTGAARAEVAIVAQECEQVDGSTVARVTLKNRQNRPAVIDLTTAMESGGATVYRRADRVSFEPYEKRVVIRRGPEGVHAYRCRWSVK